MNQKQREQQEAIERLREHVKPGDTIFCKLQHVSKSGMLRVIQLIKIENNEPLYLGWNVAKALGMTYDKKREGVKIGGTGMDMGFALVYDLSRTLFQDNFICLGADCPSNDHTNGDCDRTPHKHSNGGYALRHRWL